MLYFLFLVGIRMVVGRVPFVKSRQKIDKECFVWKWSVTVLHVSHTLTKVLATPGVLLFFIR